MALGLSVLPAAAGPVTYYPVRYTCDPSISAATCDSLNNTVGSEYSQLFTNAAANIYITMGALPAGAVAHNDQFYTTVSYADYYNALNASVGQSAADASAASSLPVPASGVAGNFSNPINAGYQVALTGALDAALGLTGAKGICRPGESCLVGCQLGPSTASTCFNGIITLSSSKLFDSSDSENPLSGQYDFFTVVQHETDEVLGTGSCIQAGTLTIGSLCLNGVVWGTSAADLFRYAAPGQRGFSIDALTHKVIFQSASEYFSIDGGQTGIADLSNSSRGDDYGDLSTNCAHVQDSTGCTSWPTGNDRNGMDLMTDGGVEIAMLDAIGYQLTHKGEELSAASAYYAPEPSSVALVSIGFGLSGVVWRRRRRAQILRS